MASIAGPCDDHVLGPRGSKAEFGASNRLGTPNSDRKPGVTFNRVRGDTYTREIPKHLPRYVRLKDYLAEVKIKLRLVKSREACDD